MKIRIRGNSVRYRLTRSEVELFCREGRLVATTNFASGTFNYALEAKPGLAEPTADFTGATITVYLPDSVCREWADSEQVGYGNSADWNDPATLSVLVEKDFACIDNTEEDQSDNFPNPKAGEC